MLLPRGPALGRPRVAVARCGAASVSGGAWEPRPPARARARVGALHAWGIFLPHSLERTKGLIDNSWEKEPVLYFRRGKEGRNGAGGGWKGGSGSDAANIG